jgi:DNA-binding CsgD family transcriptional regulator
MNNHWNLTPRQAEIMALLVSGATAGTNKHIARHLGIDARTVEEHMRRAMAKMNASNRVQAAILWDRWATGRA